MHKSIITDHIYLSISITTNKLCHIPYYILIPEYITSLSISISSYYPIFKKYYCYGSIDYQYPLSIIYTYMHLYDIRLKREKTVNGEFSIVRFDDSGGYL